MNNYHEKRRAKKRILEIKRIKQVKQQLRLQSNARNRAWIRRNSVDHFPWTAKDWLEFNS